jgi:hypothetical protein
LKQLLAIFRHGKESERNAAIFSLFLVLDVSQLSFQVFDDFLGVSVDEVDGGGEDVEAVLVDFLPQALHFVLVFPVFEVLRVPVLNDPHNARLVRS